MFLFYLQKIDFLPFIFKNWCPSKYATTCATSLTRWLCHFIKPILLKLILIFLYRIWLIFFKFVFLLLLVWTQSRFTSSCWLLILFDWNFWLYLFWNWFVSQNIEFLWLSHRAITFLGSFIRSIFTRIHCYILWWFINWRAMISTRFESWGKTTKAISFIC